MRWARKRSVPHKRPRETAGSTVRNTASGIHGSTVIQVGSVSGDVTIVPSSESGDTRLRIERAKEPPLRGATARELLRSAGGPVFVAVTGAAAALITAGALVWGWHPLWILFSTGLTAAWAGAGVWRSSRRSPLLPAAVRALAPDGGAAGGGLRYTVAEPGELTRIYTTQQLDMTPDRDRVGGRVAKVVGRTEDDRWRQRRLSIEMLLAAGTGHLVVTGEPGVGKTSLLEYVESVAWEWWRHATRATARSCAPFGNIVPLRIAARDLVGAKSVAAAFGARAQALLEEPPLAGHRWLIMVDAVDEITVVDDWRQVMGLLTAAIRQEPTSGPRARHQYLITTRELHDKTWRNLMDAGVTEYRLLPFSLPQLKRFVTAHQSGGARRLRSPDVRRVAEGKADEFIAHMRANNMLDPVRLPLLAHLATNQYFDHERSDDEVVRRVDLYSRAVDEFLSRFPQRSDGRGPGFDVLSERLRAEYAPEAEGDEHVLDAEGNRMAQALRGLLADLAHRSLDEGVDPVSAAAEALGVDASQKDSPSYTALVALMDATGLVVGSRTRKPVFCHQTFAEYLAAPRRASEYGDDVAAWRSAIADPQTRVAAVFAFDRLSAQERRTIARTLAADAEGAVSAAWLAAEGLCDDSTRDFVIDRLWSSQHGAPAGWWDAVRALSHLPENQRHLRERVAAEDTDIRFRIPAATALAAHDRDGVRTLQEIAGDNDVGPGLRVDAANRLADVEPETGLPLLRRMAEEHHRNGAVHAAVLLAGREPETGVPRLRRIARDNSLGGLARLQAAVALADYEPETGLALLRSIAVSPAWLADLRVAAASAMAGYDREEAAKLLTGQAEDGGFDPGYRVEAAHRLSGIDHGAGTALLRRFADGLYGRYRLDAAVMLAQHDRGAGVELLGRMANLTSLDARYRVEAAVELAHYEPEPGSEQLRSMATDPGITTKERLRAAGFLADVDRGAGLALLRSMATDLDGLGAVQAAAMITRLERSEGLGLLRTMAEDTSLERGEREQAARVVREHDRDAGIDLLRRIGPGDGTLDSRHW